MVSNLTVKVGADIAGLQKELQKATGSLQGFGKSMKVVGGVVAGAFALDKIIEFGKGVFNVTAEFQKFEAVLTNTLGNNSAAKAALAQITEFAVKTPFQVNELTGAFVKLANQGFVPTMEEMRKMGDVAASTGKGFDQLVEAIIDAQTGEFERLKDFGIRASKEGNRVTFTFKGVQKQVNFTSDSIREYILSLGDLNGVSGATDSISKTLGGGLSNLQDAYEQLQLAIGKAAESGGLFSKSLDFIAGGVKGLTEIFRENTIQEYIEAARFFTEAKRQAAEAGDMDAWKRANDALQAAVVKIREYKEGQEALKKAQDQTTTSANEQTLSIKQLVAQWDKANSVFKSKENPITDTKSGGFSFMIDSGGLEQMATASSRALEHLNKHLQLNTNTVAIWQEQVSARTKMAAESFAMDLGPGIAGALTDFATAIGRAAEGMGDFGTEMMKSIGGFMQQFGSALIALGIGKIALTKFSGPAMIAAGAVLTAAGASVQASAERAAQKATDKGSSSQISSDSPFRGRTSSSIQDSNPQLVTVLKGEDIWITLQNYQANNRLTHG